MQIFETLNSIELEAKNSDEFAVVRILGGTDEEVVLADRNGELRPAPRDRTLAAEISDAVRGLVKSRGVAATSTTTGAEGAPLRIVIELIRPKCDLVVFGAGHVGQALALMAVIVGYEVTVIDDRKEFASRERLPDPRINLLVSDYGSAVSSLSISGGTAIVIVTRGHQYDELCLRSVLDLPARYVGMIGSKRRVIGVFNKLVELGAPEEALKRVHAPIGLKIGARSPQEIAVAILAEIISHNNLGARD